MILRRSVAALASSKGVFAVAVLAGAFCGLGLSFGGSSHEFIARFANVNGLVSGNEVRIAGIEVGSVSSLQVGVDPRTGNQYAQVALSVDDAHWPLHKGTRIAVRPKGVLSNVFVEVEPGSPGSPALGDHPFFDIDQTSSPVNLDELSNIFDPSVRTSIRTQLQEGVIVLGGTGISDLNNTLHNANPLTSDAVPVTAVLAQRSPELDRLNGEFDTITGELAREDSNLRGLIENGNVFLHALADRQTQLQETLVHAAGTLTTLDQSLRGEEGNLRTFFQKGPQALNQAKTAFELLTPLIANVNPHIPDLEILLNELITGTGYNQNTGQDAFGNPLSTLRVDGTLPPQSESAKACGGEPVEQHC